MSPGFRAAVPLEQPGRLHIGDHLGGVDIGERMDPKGHVADQFDEHPTEPEGDERAERRVLGHADDHLVAPGDELLDQGALGIDPPHRSPDRIARRRLGTLGHVENDPADIALVEHARGDDLEDHRAADLRG
jgi:hypothetical protein